MTRTFYTLYTPDITDEQALKYVLYESGLSDYLEVSASEENTKVFKVTLTVEEVTDEF